MVFLDGSLLSSSVLVSLFRISYPDLLLTKPKARSGQIRFVHVFTCQECDRQWKKACSNKSSQKLCHIHYKTLSQFTWLHPWAVTFDLVFFVRLHQLKSWDAKVPWGYCWILSMGKYIPMLRSFLGEGII